MDLLGVLRLDELSHGLANLSMFPYFDMAHYLVSVMALREQPGKWPESSFLTVLTEYNRHNNNNNNNNHNNNNKNNKRVSFALQKFELRNF